MVMLHDLISVFSFSQADDEPRQKNRKRKAPDPTEELVKLASKRLQQPQEDSDKIAAAWAVELRKMDPQQQLFAKKAINDCLRDKWGPYIVIQWKLTSHACPHHIVFSPSLQSPSIPLHSVSMNQQTPPRKTQVTQVHISLLFSKAVIFQIHVGIRSVQCQFLF